MEKLKEKRRQRYERKAEERRIEAERRRIEAGAPQETAKNLDRTFSSANLFYPSNSRKENSVGSVIQKVLREKSRPPEHVLNAKAAERLWGHIQNLPDHLQWKLIMACRDRRVGCENAFLTDTLDFIFGNRGGCFIIDDFI